MVKAVTMKIIISVFLFGLCYCNPTPTETVTDITTPDDVQTDSSAVDPSVYLSEPIDHANKLLIDLEEHVRKYLPSDDSIEDAKVDPVEVPVYGAVDENQWNDLTKQHPQMVALIDQVHRLSANLETTITDLVSRRRYVTAAMLRSMLNYVRRVQVSLERLQNRLHAIQAAATSGQNSPGGTGVPNLTFFNNIRDRINRISEEINALVSRIRGTFSPSVIPSSPTSPSN